jgi:hypothetical protein
MYYVCPRFSTKVTTGFAGRIGDGHRCVDRLGRGPVSQFFISVETPGHLRPGPSDRVR